MGYESKTIVTKDGKVHWIDSDSHFRELIREYMGNDAAMWYELRFKDIGEINQYVNRLFPETRSLLNINKALDEMSVDDWKELFWTLSELSGWDE
jgi:hypothetical protein